MICVSCDASAAGTPAACPSCGADPLLSGRYRLEERIGRGGNGTVYRATDQQTGQQLAIKELPLRHDLDPKRQELFRREAAILRQLSHPAIPRSLGEEIAGQGRSRALYLLQEFVSGETLSAELSRHRYTEAEVSAIIDEVSSILAYLHGLSPPVVHRDIKPSNLMRRPDGRLVLIDFGTVRDALRDPQLGGSTVAGTFGYMAPEQFTGDAEPATDYYGLGVTALALLSRRDPATLFDRTGRLGWEDAVVVSAQMRRTLEGLLAPDPGQRIASSGELQRARQPAVSAAARPIVRRGNSQRRLVLAMIGITVVLSVPFGLLMLAQMLLW